jgi:hypothetical protein
MDNSLYNLLLRSFDAPLAEAERRQLDSALEASEDFRAARQQIINLRAGLQATGHQSFNPFFAERVLEHLRTPQQSIADYFMSVFRGIAIGAAVLVIICSAYNISRANEFTLESALGIHQPTLEQVLALEAPFE